MANENRGCLSSLFGLFVFARRREVDRDPETAGPDPEQVYPYESRRSLMTAVERVFFEVLYQITNGACHTFTKIRLADLISVDRETNHWKSHFERIGARHVDYVLCKLETLEPLLVIQLDDPNHVRLDQLRGDDFIDAALAAAGIPVLHFKVHEFYDPKEIRKMIKDAILASRPMAT